MRKRDRNVAVGTVIAAGIGYVAGMLTAPKSGRETRKDLQKAALKAKKETEKTFKNLHNELTAVIDLGKSHSLKFKDARKEEFEEALNQAMMAKKKVGEILSSIHEGESENKDLQKAVKDVKSAIANLRKYIEKESKTK